MPDAKAMESRAFGSPSRYIQGPDEINNLPVFSANFGKTALAIIDPFFYDEYQSKIQKMFRDAGMQPYTVCFLSSNNSLLIIFYPPKKRFHIFS